VNICTLSDIKTRLGIASDSTEYDAVINAIIPGIEKYFDTYTGRNLVLNSVDVIEYAAGGSPWIRTRRFPVVSITSIKEAFDYDFANADSLLADTDYRLKADSGLILRLHRSWLDTFDGVEVKYKGGYKPAGQTPAAGETAMPDDLREAAISQSCLVFKRRDDIGLSGTSFDGGSFSKFTSFDLLPMVKDILESYRRVSLC
jgi:hypothetical protein